MYSRVCDLFVSHSMLSSGEASVALFAQRSMQRLYETLVRTHFFCS